MAWKHKRFDELDVHELYNILKLRNEIFVLEQNCVYLDTDDRDQASEHLFFTEDDGAVTACCRLMPPGLLFREAAIGRVVVSRMRRGNGLAREMMRLASERIEERWPDAGIHISGQLYLENFYSSCGFRTISDVYMEDGIKHVAMVRYRYAAVKYLGHSCFAVATPLRVLLFDYGVLPDRDSWPELSRNLPALNGRPLYIFSSHQHGDHYAEATLSMFPETEFFLHGHDSESGLRADQMQNEQIDTSEIKAAGARELAVYPRQQIKLDDMTIYCSGSSDQGTAFLIHLPELTIVHAGDLARWDDLDQYKLVQQIETDWLAECTGSTGKPDLAFLPVSTSDGYQEQPILDGLEDMISKMKPGIVIPMHGHGFEYLYDSFADWLLTKPELSTETQVQVLKAPGNIINLQVCRNPHH
ncbi:MAG: GNAT family N-acetyltransferase [Clostridiaceae bacterium]|nr:GNAT family N-acetyltransferase [Clostridiaceae bacterium]